MTDLWTLFDWAIYGLVRYILYLAPLVRAPSVDRDIPLAWWSYCTFDDWLSKDWDDGRPNEHWIHCWLRMTLGEALRTAVESAKPYVDDVRGYLVSIIGVIDGNYGSVSDWVRAIAVKLGPSIPWWVTNVYNALDWLREKLPDAIADSWASWEDLFDDIGQRVRDWARSTYDHAVDLAHSAYNWVAYQGHVLYSWYMEAQPILADIRDRPYAWVSAILGPTWAYLVWFVLDPKAAIVGYLGANWPRLSTFADTALDYYYALWSDSWDIIRDFFANPMQWIYDRTGDYLAERWG